MESNRAQTLEALSTFIQAQRTFLSNTKQDIERLRQLREEAARDKSLSAENLLSKTTSFKLSQRAQEVSEPPKNLNWAFFKGHDSSQVHALGTAWRERCGKLSVPSPFQRLKLSPLQKFVKDARRIIADPILDQFALMSDVETSSEEELDPEIINKEVERAKIRELKKRKIACSLTVPFRARRPNGVFIRRDVEDESGLVDISLDDNLSIPSRPSSLALDSQPMDVDVNSKANVQPLMARSGKVGRVRRPTVKAKSQMLDSSAPKTRRRGSNIKSAATDKEPLKEMLESPIDSSASTTTLGKRSRDTGKPKPETYKQAWSVSEQHLLERLLEEIPDGEKNRWQKISKTMNGRRTPRQVASRVQKYFEKLKRFGVDINATGGVG